MRLLTIRVVYLRYGAENHMLRVARGAAESGLDVHAAFPRRNGTASMIRDCEEWKISYRPFDWTQRFNGRSLPRLLQMLKLLRQVRPDIVQYTASGWQNEIWVPSLACALSRIPMLAVFQTVVEPQPTPDWHFSALAWARRQRQRWMAVSGHVLSNLQTTFRTRSHELGILPNGVEIPELADESETQELRRDVRRELDLPPNTRSLLTTARVESQKGCGDLLEIAPNVIGRHPDTVFVWLGDGDKRSAVEAQVREKGLARHVRFLGYRTDVDRFVRASDIFFFPSHNEGGCSSSIREAMVNGLPIVCSDAGGIPEVVEGGVHALMFPAKDAAAMLDRLCHALDHPGDMRALAEQARNRIKDFSAERMVANYLRVFRELAARAPL